MEYTLSYKGFEAIVDNIGAELISFKDAHGTEYIWQGHPSGWTGKNPNLFPAIGAVKSEGILYDGKAYPTPRHGFARHSAFTLVEKTDSSITMELCSNADTLALYPYPFRLRISHSLGEGSFTTSYEVLNIGEANMHYCVGGHTAFNCPLFGDGSFEDWRITFAKEETVPAMLPLEGGFIDFNYTMPAIKEGRYIPLDHSLHDKIDTLIFRDLNSTSVSLTGPKGKGISFDFEGFPLIAFWTAPGKNAPYICLEPWVGCGALGEGDGEFSAKPYAVTLAPNESKTFSYTVTII